MSLSRASFLRALIGAPFAAKAVERIIANGVAKPAPVSLTPEGTKVHRFLSCCTPSGAQGMEGYAQFKLEL
jgi:hypothetical protein